jgi:hypothetical protein
VRCEGDFWYGGIPPMADEKSSSSKNIVLWIITVALIALAIFLYKK